ncbi:unnamed protein product [Paramecium primaurelia]|uniref:Uncharacterized protein n=1 Tax=Paramecium primaurelia TaxID=5886 RepID=A0A8S1NK73_PARPR|nr:unnamed protein product [Paramecium primaurelia]
MQSQSIGEDCLELFDANIYGDGQTRNYGSCYKPPTYEEIEEESKLKNIKLIPNDKEKFFELILKEQQVRLDKNVQDLYGQLNYSGVVEELIHAEIFKHFGYDDCPLNNKLYYALTRKYINDPELKKQVFFWRNNVMHGCRIGLNEQPPEIQLLNLEQQKVCLQDLMLNCHKENRLLVVFAGSIT